jgi:hypothetical protein
VKSKFIKKTDGLEIEVSDVRGKVSQLIEAFSECAEGRCSCPTEEYTKLESLQIEHAPGNITLRLKVKEGLQLDELEIERCLAFSEERAEQQT